MRACDVLTSVSKGTLSEATKLAQVVGSVDLFVPIFLREIEAISTTCRSHTAVNLPVDSLRRHLESFTGVVLFATTLARSHDAICLSLAKQSHLISSAVQYVTTSYQALFLASAEPGLIWLHSASVGALIELLVVTGLGAKRTSIMALPLAPRDDCAHRENEIGRIVTVLMKCSFEMAYITGGLCGMVSFLGTEWWSKNPFLYLEVWASMRTVILHQETHKWCALLPSFTNALSALLKVGSPIRHALLSSRWNLTLTSRLLKFLLSREHPLCCPTCHTPLSATLAALLKALLTPHPVWQADLKKEAGLGPRYSFLDFSEVEARVRELVQEGRVMDADALLGVAECFEGWSRSRAVRNWLDREIRAGSSRPANEDRWYRIFRPVEGAMGVLVAAS
ncbi:hypothetical protein FN846DRAFT_961556 [Sphaerosporella brunnea]|uniref:Uncharacterized protein n=1 Tax=Sphaerosporella brunnea TaxID=1250544 RepID=A0A5J5ENH8_9PEZI|nr:hypothetical protein FN846DRAFT_961556 [Sphaerosporella brunnea]